VPPTVFQMIFPGEAGPTDILGLWQPLSAESFAIEDPSSQTVTVWRVDLPGDRDQALYALDRQQTNLKLVGRSSWRSGPGFVCFRPSAN